MSAATDCNCACPTPTITHIPGETGAAGAAGTNGTNGVNAYTTLTTLGLTLPAAAGPVVLATSVGSSAWASIGQVIFITDGTNWGHFRVLTKPSTASFTLEWLDYDGDAAGLSVIAFATSSVSPAGIQPAIPSPTSVANGGTNSATALLARAALGVGGANLSVYASGSSYGLTATPALLDFGTTDPSLVITSPGTWALFARARIDFNALGVTDGRTVTVKLRRTNNTAADIGNASVGFKCPVNTTGTGTAQIVDLPPIAYVTTNSDDILQLWGSVSVLDNAGNLQAVEASIVAVKLFDQTV